MKCRSCSGRTLRYLETSAENSILPFNNPYMNPIPAACLCLANEDRPNILANIKTKKNKFLITIKKLLEVHKKCIKQNSYHQYQIIYIFFCVYPYLNKIIKT